MKATMDPRYEGRPFLRLVECYILERIGKLSERDGALLSQMTPKLRETYSREGSWAEIVEGEMHFDAGVSRTIAENWARWCAQRGGHDPEAFARAFADAVIK